jgi:hypothetical protein
MEYDIRLYIFHHCTSLCKIKSFSPVFQPRHRFSFALFFGVNPKAARASSLRDPYRTGSAVPFCLNHDFSQDLQDEQD